MERDVFVREVGLRDGLQNVSTFFPTPLKKAWIAAEAAAGVPEIQLCSFVPAKVVPQFTDASAIVSYALSIPRLHVSALAPNLKGAEHAFAAGIHELDYVVSVSESHNMSNVRRTPAESMEDFKRIRELRDSNDAYRDITLSGGLSTVFGCSMEGAVLPSAVLRLAEQYVEFGADQLNIADTVGYANPKQVKDMFSLLESALGDIPLVAHFHDTRGLGLANAYAALETGVTRFDATLGGLGGCPFAPGATGNIVMEDLLFMFESMGLRTGVDLESLLEVRNIEAEGLPGEPLHGALAKAKLPKGFKAGALAVAGD